MSGLRDRVLAELACASSFLETLEEEDRAIAQGRFDALAPLTARKRELLDELAELDRLRELAQTELGFGPGHAGASAAARADAGLRDSWTALLAVAERARAANQRVAAKVHTHLDFASDALGFLQRRGKPLYGPDGARESAARGGAPLATG